LCGSFAKKPFPYGSFAKEPNKRAFIMYSDALMGHKRALVLFCVALLQKSPVFVWLVSVLEYNM